MKKKGPDGVAGGLWDVPIVGHGQCIAFKNGETLQGGLGLHPPSLRCQEGPDHVKDYPSVTEGLLLRTEENPERRKRGVGRSYKGTFKRSDRRTGTVGVPEER